MTIQQARRQVPGRGSTLPDLSGTTPEGTPLCTRDFYMRRNLAVLFTGSGPQAAEWVAEAAEQRAAAHAEAGEVLLVVPPGVETAGLPALVDPDGSLTARCGLTERDLPALFIADRYGTIFAANHGQNALADLRPRDIPGWLEFIACRCT